jgi:hypothetical protein
MAQYTSGTTSPYTTHDVAQIPAAARLLKFVQEYTGIPFNHMQAMLCKKGEHMVTHNDHDERNAPANGIVPGSPVVTVTVGTYDTDTHGHSGMHILGRRDTKHDHCSLVGACKNNMEKWEQRSPAPPPTAPSPEQAEQARRDRLFSIALHQRELLAEKTKKACQERRLASMLSSLRGNMTSGPYYNTGLNSSRQKRKCEEPGQKGSVALKQPPKERGGRSGQVEDQNCPICLEVIPDAHRFALPTCKHQYCVECFARLQASEAARPARVSRNGVLVCCAVCRVVQRTSDARG